MRERRDYVRAIFAFDKHCRSVPCPFAWSNRELSQVIDVLQKNINRYTEADSRW
jgi:hypothetical protein